MNCIWSAELAIMPSHQQNMHVFADGCKNMNDVSWVSMFAVHLRWFQDSILKMSSASPEVSVLLCHRHTRVSHVDIQVRGNSSASGHHQRQTKWKLFWVFLNIHNLTQKVLNYRYLIGEYIVMNFLHLVYYFCANKIPKHEDNILHIYIYMMKP